MQDWITDDLAHVRPSNGASTQLREKKSVRYVVSVLLAAVIGLVTACAAIMPNGYVDATAWSANYTDDYISEFHLETTSGKNLLLSGIQVKEFSKGGTGSSECCSPIPGVGQTIKVVWRVRVRHVNESQWKTYSKNVTITGAVSRDTSRHSYLIVRFFPDSELEAEFVPGDDPRGAQNPRVDRLFSGQLVMRHTGE